MGEGRGALRNDGEEDAESTGVPCPSTDQPRMQRAKRARTSPVLQRMPPKPPPSTSLPAGYLLHGCGQTTTNVHTHTHDERTKTAVIKQSSALDVKESRQAEKKYKME